MMRKFFTACIVLLLLSAQSYGGTYYFAFDTPCKKAYQYYMALQLDEGNNAVNQAVKADPYNLMAIYISDYGDCLSLLFNANKHDYDQLQGHLSQRIALIEKADDNTPWYRLCKAGIYMHWAFVDLRMGENFKAATTFRKSYLLLKENKKQYPDFEYNNLFFGLEETVVGTVPDDYKWIVSLLGLKGDVKKGVGKIDNFISRHNANDILYQEAVLFNVYLRFYLLSQQEEVWKYLSSGNFPAQGNLLYSFVKANIALNYRKADVALQTLKQVQTLPGAARFPMFDYETGAALLHKGNLAAITYLNRFLAAYKGDFFIKDAWQKIAYSYYLKGDMVHANEARQRIKKYGTTGVDADKQAQRFAEQDTWPLLILLQTRLLTDGGYYQQALARLGIKSETDFPGIADKAEYNFRMGRIYDELGNDDKAIMYYNRAISIGRERKEHFAARAALQMGFIYERRKDNTAALSSYQSCVGMPVQDFKNSIMQQAKAGINRLTIK